MKNDGGEKQRRKAVVVGAGPVGCLAALALMRMGWIVELYEGRPDTRLASSKTSATFRSINLAISSRGITALRAIDPDVANHLLNNVIPMRGRMIHDSNGGQHSQLYDRDGQCINSVDRGLLNDRLLDEVSASTEIRVFYQHKLTTADFDSRILTFRDLKSNSDVQVKFDFCIGADGSYSNVRRQMMRVLRMDFQQTYIPHEYLELRMPPGKDASGNAAFVLDPNHLHIWPRHSLMLIALPNKDKSFTCTLFAPTSDFDKLINPAKALQWFREQFPDALPLLSEKAVLEGFRSNPRSPLISIKMNPYHYKDRVVVLGDAAHSMVPFYGQGLNCGLEDIRVLAIILQKNGVDPIDLSSTEGLAEDANLARALSEYSQTRHEDLLAISDLAMNNYVEMRHSVATPSYLFLRALDNIFSFLTSRAQVTPTSVEPQLKYSAFPSASPSGWVPLYTMVTFRPDISYSVAKKKAESQQKIVVGLSWAASIIGLAGTGWLAFRFAQALSRVE